MVTNRKRLPRIVDFIGVALVVIALTGMAIGYISILIFRGAKDLNDIISPFNFWNYSLVLISLVPGAGLRFISVYLKNIDPSNLTNWLVRLWACAAGIPLILWQVTIIYLFGFSRLHKILNPYNLLYYIPAIMILFGPIFLFNFIGGKLHMKYARSMKSSDLNVGA